MSKATHQKQLERARAKRAAEQAAQRKGRLTVVVIVGVLVAAAVALGVVLLPGGGEGEPIIDDPASIENDDATDDAAAADVDVAEASMSNPQPAVAEPCAPAEEELPTATTDAYDAPPETDLGGATTVTATMETTCGTIVLELDAAGSPVTAANFAALARDGYYDGVGFHRVINGFMIQGGDPTGTGTGCVGSGCEVRLPGYAIDDELATAQSLVDTEGGYPRGTLAMANAGPDTGGSQFFIVQGDPGYALPPSYAVFGRVVEGMDVVDRIAQGPVTGDQAIDPVIILSVDVS